MIGDRDNCELAKFVSKKSTNERIKVGAVLVGARTFAACNDNERHAEINVLTAEGHTIYIYPVTPCPNCVAAIIRSGVKRVVTYYDPTKAPPQRPEQVELSAELLRNAGIEHCIIRDHDDREAREEV
jgi:deoxycytidylate deaminase